MGGQNTHSVFRKLNKNCYGHDGIDYPGRWRYINLQKAFLGIDGQNRSRFSAKENKIRAK